MSIEKIKETFESNFLDGDKVNDCGGAMIRAEDIWEFLRTSLEEYGREVGETPDLPMGASNWMEQGIKYGYLEHFNLKQYDHR